MLSPTKLDLNLLEANKNAVAREYWDNRLAGFECSDYLGNYSLDILKLQECSRYIVYNTQAPQQTWEDLKKFAVSGKAQHIVLLAALSLFIQRCSAVPDVIIFNPVYRQEASGTEDHIVPVRMNEEAGSTFIEQIKYLKQHLINDFNHPQRLIESMLHMEQQTFRRLFKIGLLVEEVQYSGAFDSFHPDILFVFSGKDALDLSIRCDAAQFDSERIAQMAVDFFDWLNKLVTDKEKNLTTIQLSSPQERVHIAKVFNDTDAGYPRHKTIMDLFQEQVNRAPDNTALRVNNKLISYRELDHRSSQVAGYLQTEKGIVAGDLVGIMLEREEWLVPVIFGVLKAGAAYVPVDPSYPPARISAIAEDSGMKALITRDRFFTSAPASIPVVSLDNCSEYICCMQSEYNRISADDRGLAYVIYTSGSTGHPKGVMIAHHSVVNRICWMQKKYPLHESDVLLQKTPVVFDVSVWELCWWAICGASLCLLPPGEEKDPEAIITAIDHHKITCIHFVPSMLTLFLKQAEDSYGKLHSLKRVFASGEALKPEQVQLFAKTLHAHAGTALVNLYGPTEATVDVSYYQCDFRNEGKTVPIGKPIDNTRLYILDKNNHIVPVGVPGELYIAGDGLALGYLNNAGLTQELFMEYPGVYGERLYRTGDLAKWLPDGNIVYLGRADHQVKVSGFRIELGEIEACLSTHQQISNCTVITRDIADDTCLIACYVAEYMIEEAQLKSFLGNLLPAYMIPAHFIYLSVMPLTTNGKADRKALQQIPLKKDVPVIDPANELEEKLAEIWARVLGRKPSSVSTNKSFFELGGNSLKLVRVNGMFNRELHLKTTVNEMLNYPTIESFIAFVNGENNNAGNISDEAAGEVEEMRATIDFLNNNI